MSSIKFKHVVIGLGVAFILFLFWGIGDEDYSFEDSGSYIQSHQSLESYESGHESPYSSTVPSNPSNLTRHEVLQTKVKGYREETYWGEHHPTYEKVREMSDYEYNDFVEEVTQKDVEVYWGATY